MLRNSESKANKTQQSVVKMGLHKFFIALTTLLLCTTSSQASGSSKDEVPNNNRAVVTFQSWQLSYKGSLSHEQYTPSSVQCYDRGHGAYDAQRDCKAELSPEVRLANTIVVCKNNEDPKVVSGSCVLEYTLELTGAGKSGKDDKYGYTGYLYTVLQNYLPSSPMLLFIIMCVICLGWFIPRNFTFKNTATNSEGSTSNINIGNDLFGNRNQGLNPPNTHDNGSGWSGSDGRTSTSSARSGTTRRSTGFGGTTRR